MKQFDVENRNRNAQYNFFKTYEDPFFNITANLEVTNLYKYCKQHQKNFFFGGSAPCFDGWLSRGIAL